MNVHYFKNNNMKINIMKNQLIMVLCLLFSSTAWADTTTETFNFIGQASDAELSSISTDNVTVTLDKGTSQSSPVMEGTDYLKFYGGNTMTVTSGKLITAITFTCDELHGSSNLTATTGTFTDGAWSNSDGTTSVTITNEGNRMVQIKSITFTLADNPSLLADPTFSSTAYEDNTFIDSTKVAISHDTATKIVYTIDGTVPSSTNGTEYTDTITLHGTATVKAIAYSGGNSSSVVSTYYKSLTGIRSIRAAIAHGETTGARTAILSNAIVTYKDADKTYYYIQDGTSPSDGAGIVLIASGHVDVGNSITGEVTWSGTMRDGLTVIRTIDVINGTITTDVTIPDAVEVTAADLQSDIEKYESYYIKVIDIETIATNAADGKTANTGEDSVEIYNATGSKMYLAAADESAFTGYAVDNPSTGVIQISVFDEDNVSQSSTINFADDYNYATRVEAAAYTIPDDLEVTYITGCTNGVLAQESITDIVPASTPVLLKAAETGHKSTINFLNFDTTTAPSGNLLCGSEVMHKSSSVHKFYILNKKDGVIGFYWAAADGGKPSSYVAPYAYLALNKNTTSAKMLTLDDESATTAINVMTEEEEADQPIYNLQGIRVSKATKGIYLRGGKKYIVK